MSLEGVEVATKITGSTAKEIAIFLMEALKSKSSTLKLKGKARMTSMLKLGEVLEIFSVKESDLAKFAQGAKLFYKSYRKEGNLLTCGKHSLKRNLAITIMIDVKKTLNLEQVNQLIEASKETPIYMQVLFAVLMGLRRGETTGVKYSDVDYIRRTLTIERQLGIKPETEKDEVEAKTYTKQEIPLKTPSSYRVLPIPDLVFEAILEQRKQYEKNRRRRVREFQDLNFICCSTYGRPRSRQFHWKYYKKILQENNLPDIRFHDLRVTYATMLLKNDFNLKVIASMLGHAKEIISVDVYGDNKEIIRDCLTDIEPFIYEVIPKSNEQGKSCDWTGVEEMVLIADEYLQVA